MENTFETCLKEFSPDLILDWIVQHIESHPKYHINNHPIDEITRKWIKLSDTLHNCIKYDLKNCKWVDGKQTGVSNRQSALEVILRWSLDISVLSIKLSEIASKISDAHLQKDILALVTYFSTLSDLCKLLDKKEKPPVSRKDEVVFLFEDES